MLRIIAIAFLFVILSIQGEPVRGAHIIGGDISYECLGNDMYRISMKIYRDCDGGGAPFDSQFPNNPFNITGSVSVYRGNSQTPFLTQYLDPPEITMIEPDVSNPCLIVPPGICVQEGVYTFTLELPRSESSYHIVYQRCCRNNTINNITSPGSTGSTYSMEITAKAQEICNNSPVFDEYPPIVICQGEPISFDHSATDPDGNTQLVYEFCTPLDGGGLAGSTSNDPDLWTQPNGVAPDPDLPPPFDGVNFVQPTFTFNRPMAGDPLIQIDPNTGLITGTPEILGQFVVGVCVKEYLNGTLLSVTRRDFQFNVAVCEPAVFAKVRADEEENQTFVIRSCGEQTVDFINESYNEQFIQAYRWIFEIDGEEKTFNDRNVSVTFPGVGTYEGTMIVNPGTDCSDTAQLEVHVFPSIDANFDYQYDTCKAAPVQFIDQSSSGSGQLTGWSWSFGDGDTSSARNPLHKYQQAGNLPVTLEVRDVNRCVDELTQEIPYFPVPELVVVDPSSYRGCVPARLQFINLSTPIDSNYTTNWSFGDGGTSTELNPYHTFEESGTYTISLEIISPIGCKTSETYPDLIKILESPVADFTYSPTEVNSFQPEVQFADQSRNAVGWQWAFGGEQVSFVQNPTYTFQDTGAHFITQTVFHPNGCTDSITKRIDVIPKATYFLPNAFTPNGDGTNDEFRGKGVLLGVEDFEMTVWNRYGEKVFETRDPTEGWNGRKNNSGTLAPAGVYVCIVHFTGPRGERQRLRGFATLIR